MQKDVEICLIVAENESQAMEKFVGNIYYVFNNYDDDCTFISIKEVTSPDLICYKHGFMWKDDLEFLLLLLWTMLCLLLGVAVGIHG